MQCLGYHTCDCIILTLDTKLWKIKVFTGDDVKIMTKYIGTLGVKTFSSAPYAYACDKIVTDQADLIIEELTNQKHVCLVKWCHWLC